VGKRTTKTAQGRTASEERELILRLAKRVHGALADERAIVNGDERPNMKRRVGAAVMKEFIEAIEREEHLNPETPIQVL
jgi:hypothetical protein